MDPSTLARIHTFTHEVLRPTFSGIEHQLNTQLQCRIIIASDANTGHDEVDALLQLMHPGQLYLPQTLNNSSFPKSSVCDPQQWIGESLYVEILQDLETESRSVGQYCLSIVFTITPTEEIQLTSIIGYSQPNSIQSQIQALPFEDEHTPLSFEDIDSETIGLHFTETFMLFESQVLDPTTILTAEPEPENLAEFNYTQSNSLNAKAQTIILSETRLVPPSETEPSEPVLDTFTLAQQARHLSKTLSPQGFPISHKQNSNLTTTSEIRTIKDRYGRNTDLILEYSPSISKTELIEQMSRLGHYESLNHLAHSQGFVQKQINTWLKQYKHPSSGAIAPHLHQSITQLCNALNQRIETLLGYQLQNRSSVELETEVNGFKTQQQYQQTLLKQIDQNPLLGYLDTSLLKDDHIQITHPLFTRPNQLIDIPAQYLKNKDEQILLALIDACQSERYQAYCNGQEGGDNLRCFVKYTITQKLYPNRATFIGQSPKAVFPRLECLWGHANELTIDPNPLMQIWCVYPMIRTDPPQWIVIAATTDNHPLDTIALEKGEVAQEGTYDYLVRSLGLMAQCEDEYTHALAGLVGEALDLKRVKYLQMHQTLNPRTDEPRDIIKMQFQIFR